MINNSNNNKKITCRKQKNLNQKKFFIKIKLSRKIQNLLIVCNNKKKINKYPIFIRISQRLYIARFWKAKQKLKEKKVIETPKIVNMHIN